jgi:putative tryptophan/tyrosine transport system substrate-binding protein
MRRREFITIVGNAAASWPFAARAQRPATPVIGFLNATDRDYRVASFRSGLEELGYVEDRNVRIEYRWAQGSYDRLPVMAAELVHLNVAVIATGGGATVALAAKAATSTIPIVFNSGSDPVSDGLVASLNRPGGNVTGVSFLAGTLAAKQVEFLHAMVPNATTIGFLIHPTNASADFQISEVKKASEALGLTVVIAKASSEKDFEDVFVKFNELRVGAMIISSDAFFNYWRDRLVDLAARSAMPAIHSYREFVAAGGLMSYGTSISEAYRLTGVYVGRILRGERPADLPVQQSTKVELFINLKTAKALGISVPVSLLGRADEVIE